MRAFDATPMGAAVVGATAGSAPATSVATARSGTGCPRTRGVLTPCTALSWAESGIRTHRLAAILTTVLVVPACGGEGVPTTAGPGPDTPDPPLTSDRNGRPTSCGKPETEHPATSPPPCGSRPEPPPVLGKLPPRSHMTTSEERESSNRLALVAVLAPPFGAGPLAPLPPSRPPSIPSPRRNLALTQETTTTHANPIRTLHTTFRVVATAAALLILSATASAEQVLRIATHAGLAGLDPVWTTANITRTHGYMVYDTLFALDESFQIQPQMVDTWQVSEDQLVCTFTLRDGLT